MLPTKKVEIKFLTEKMYLEFFKEPAEHSTFALAAVEDGEVVGVAGMFLMAGRRAVLFSDSPDGWIKAHPLTSVKIAKRLLAMAEKHGWSIVSFANEHREKAGPFLEHFGFVKTDNGYEHSNERDFERN